MFLGGDVYLSQPHAAGSVRWKAGNLLLRFQSHLRAISHSHLHTLSFLWRLHVLPNERHGHLEAVEQMFPSVKCDLASRREKKCKLYFAKGMFRRIWFYFGGVFWKCQGKWALIYRERAAPSFRWQDKGHTPMWDCGAIAVRAGQGLSGDPICPTKPVVQTGFFSSIPSSVPFPHLIPRWHLHPSKSNHPSPSFSLVVFVLSLSLFYILCNIFLWRIPHVSRAATPGSLYIKLSLDNNVDCHS